MNALSILSGDSSSILPETKEFALAGRSDGVDKTILWPEMPPPSSGSPGGGTSLPWKRLLNACCNHLFFAVACCDRETKLHSYILRSSTELDAAIGGFRAIAEDLGSAAKFGKDCGATQLWEACIAYDAPRALSDACCATAAAVFFDSDWVTFRNVSWIPTCLSGSGSVASSRRFCLPSRHMSWIP